MPLVLPLAWALGMLYAVPRTGPWAFVLLDKHSGLNRMFSMCLAQSPVLQHAATPACCAWVKGSKASSWSFAWWRMLPNPASGESTTALTALFASFCEAKGRCMAMAGGCVSPCSAAGRLLQGLPAGREKWLFPGSVCCPG